jgi:hypothetical protein
MQQLSFDQTENPLLLAALLASTAWVVAFWSYRFLRWLRQRPSGNARRLEGRVIDVANEQRTIRVETADGTRWQIAGLASWIPTAGQRVLVVGAAATIHNYRDAEHHVQAETVRRAWPKLRSLELPTALFCLVSLLATAGLFLG